jgi:DNA-3-methyladenine glycosylase II
MHGRLHTCLKRRAVGRLATAGDSREGRLRGTHRLLKCVVAMIESGISRHHVSAATIMRPRNAFFLTPRPPFRLDLTVWTLRRRVDNAVDRWDGQVYRRVLPRPGGGLEVAVTQVGSPETSKLRVTVAGEPLRSELKVAVSSVLGRLLGLELDLGPFYRFAAHQTPLNALAARFRGMKPPRFASVFEAVINAIACQQLTLTVGIQLLNRLAQACGQAVRTGDVVAYAFPRPDDLIQMSATTLRELGFSRQKARAMLELSAAVVREGLDLESVAALPDDAATARLSELRGVGRWTAEYVLLRGLGRLHMFPGDDVGARNNVQAWLRLASPLDYDGVGRALNRWRRYGGLIYFHLLLDRISEMGFIEPSMDPVAVTRRVHRSSSAPR